MIAAKDGFSLYVECIAQVRNEYGKTTLYHWKNGGIPLRTIRYVLERGELEQSGGFYHENISPAECHRGIAFSCFFQELDLAICSSQSSQLFTPQFFINVNHRSALTRCSNTQDRASLSNILQRMADLITLRQVHDRELGVIFMAWKDFFRYNGILYFFPSYQAKFILTNLDLTHMLKSK